MKQAEEAASVRILINIAHTQCWLHNEISLALKQLLNLRRRLYM